MDNREGKTALLLMDLQNGIVSRYGDQTEVVEPFQKALSIARENDIPVFFIRVGFSEGYPEVNSRNKIFSAISQSGGMTLSDDSTQIHESVKPQENEAIITKYRFSAFAGSTLEVILRSQGINSLILSGISTSGVVLSTLREAADKDFSLTVLKDACLDADAEVHQVLIEKVFPRQAEVITVEDWANTLNK
ncbi:cysteine hydrolase [Halobacillus salinarum]|uniref:Cysteine hydrolase n=1 Tax=Halobacillus salinarum TaxID=2932257 RepID=A0ABY4EUU2_9BACI|nr:isochorismatase family cysteine hydrolase [Halobacillus salinarum]UOQ45911.1 cysteine hydrolase [Halobacillus salinarum]